VNSQSLMKWLKLWWPVLVWAAAIASFSTDSFSAEHTSRLIVPLLHWLFPAMSRPELLRWHHYIRKLGHLSEYFVLSLLVLHALRESRTGSRLEWAVTSVAIAAGWAGLDELHQAFVPSRGPSMRDVMIDVAGAIAAQAVVAVAAAIQARRSAASGLAQ
jgi:VanZ family protein